jgi:hypothetical protein
MGEGIYGIVHLFGTRKKDEECDEDKEQEHVQLKWMFLGNELASDILVGEMTWATNKRPDGFEESRIPDKSIIEVF